MCLFGRVMVDHALCSLPSKDRGAREQASSATRSMSKRTRPSIASFSWATANAGSIQVNRARKSFSSSLETRPRRYKPGDNTYDNADTSDAKN